MALLGRSLTIALWAGLANVPAISLAAPAWPTPAPEGLDRTEATPRHTPLIVRRHHYNRYRQVIERTQAMVSDPMARQLADALDLNILNVTWEDTGRFYGSAVGPNISDMTIQVQQQDPDTERYQLHLMPVIRHPNFADLSADIPLENFFVRVGNEKGEDLRRVSLAEVLGDLRSYLHTPDSWAGRLQSLLAPERDSHVLVSAQACFLPIPQAGIATFNPVLFNYQSRPGDPAVLTILATREGTSVTIIDNQRDGFEAGRTWGQRLFFNKNGERASFTGQRLSDFQADQASIPEAEGTVDEDTAGLNMVLLIQVPLKQRAPFSPAFADEAMPLPQAAAPLARLSGPSDVEEAVIGHGAVEGPFTEIDGLAIERDPAYPIRVTVQFYKATSNGVVTAADMAEIRQQIDRVYADADYVGSLVLDGPSDRPTEHDGPKDEPPDWWQRFWEFQQNWGNREGFPQD
ncbi:hypothetical protein [Leptolyngbya sp. PCC 6406]|uniref:hypothetical protein n=1 Tax=Leptolyngbya sp. PCC 6406 TaxID=1173264 RepID=UPI001CECB509|nr:hypothetical protein [Leptolyngbya sp. PCC 6406]